MNRKTVSFAVLFAILLTAYFLFTFTDAHPPLAQSQSPKPPVPVPIEAKTSSKTPLAQELSAGDRQVVTGTLKTKLRQRFQQRGARPKEGIIAFKTKQAYDQFLARAARAGIQILGKIDALYTVRIGNDSIDALANDFFDHAVDYGEVASNYFVSAPATAPAAQDRAARIQVPLGNNLLSFLGVTSDNHTWGQGVTVAVLDSGVAPDPTFGTGHLQFLDIGLGTTPSKDQEGGHGTAVASLVAGNSSDAPGVAPATNLLSVRVAGDDGKSDIFTVAQGIVAAVDAGANILNISLGGYETTDTLNRAIDYAISKGAVIVAAAGNDQAAQLSWPAADPRVVSVGAVDALEQQVIFSNSGPQLQITAPGYGIQTAWTDGSRVLMDGTSASAPVVAGAIAAIMSQNPGMSANDAWLIVQKYTSDGGPAGTDPDYGHGVINLGWAMARNDPSRIDTAVSSHYYDSATSTMDFVVQNRSSQAVGNLTLDVSSNGTTNRYPIAWLNAGATQVVTLPVNQADLIAQGHLDFVTQLNNPSGVIDLVPSNNRKISSLAAPTTTTPTPVASKEE